MKRDLARAVAGHLVAVSWTAPDLARRLRGLLPNALDRHGPRIAQALIAWNAGPVTPRRDQITQALLDDPSFDHVARFAAQHRLRLAPNLAPARFAPAPPFDGFDLPILDTSVDLAEWLGLTPLQLVRFADLRGLSARSAQPFGPHYRHHLIAKPSGGLRLIEEPKPMLKRLQRRVLSGILDHVPPHNASFGFTRRRNAPQAAARHAGEALVACFDLAQFFPSVGYPRVYGLFRAMGYAESVADDLTGLSTAVTPQDLLRRHGLDPRFSARHLPQGAPTSPALANLCLFRLDRRLHGLAQSLGAAYTRYADDLTFSGEAWIAPSLATAVPAIVTAEGFALNSAKTRFQPAHNRQITTGIAVNAHVNLPRPAYDRLKAAIHQLPVPPHPREAQILAGRVAWALSLNPKRGEKLAQALALKLAPPG